MALGKSSHLLITNKTTLSLKAVKSHLAGSFSSSYGLTYAVIFMVVMVTLLSWFWLKPAVTDLYSNWSILAALTPLTSLTLLIRWLRWHFLARCFNLRLPAKTSLKLYLVTLPTLITPLHLGELLRAALLNRRYTNAWSILSQVWLTERLADLFILGSFLLVVGLGWQLALAITALNALLICFACNTIKPKTIQGVVRPGVWAVVALTSTCLWLLSGLGLWLVLPGPANLIWLLGLSSLEPSGLTLATRLQAEAGDARLPLNLAGLFWLGSSGLMLAFGLLAVSRWRSQLMTILAPLQPKQRFQAIAPDYTRQIPAHVRDRLIPRKVTAMQRFLQASKLPPDGRGLDLGCGPGWYASRMARLGYRIIACDFVQRQVEAARQQAVAEQTRITPQVADAGTLPYADNSFDFIYSINLIHHLTPAEAQQKTLAEIVRVLKPGGVFFLQEINTHNPFFAFYMGYIFPLLRNIDDGTEQWLKPSALPWLKGARWSDDIIHFTFLPDFTPPGLLPLLIGFEQFLERVMRRWSAHYIACLVKEGRP